MHAHHLQHRATVGHASPAGNAGATIEVRYQADKISIFKSDGFITFNKFAGQFMAEDPGITEERLIAFKSMNISSANSNFFTRKIE
jgi:hypothetical protein